MQSFASNDTQTSKQAKSVSKIGGIAQLGERLHGMQEVSGSIPLTSTSISLLVVEVVQKLLGSSAVPIV